MSKGDLGQIVRQLAVAGDRDRPDRELLERFVAGRDETAFAALVHRHGPLVLGVCRRVLHDGHEAEDALQATFLILARRASRVRWQESVRSWLYLVAGRVARAARARRQQRQQKEREASSARSACSEPSWKDLCGVLDEEIARLPEKERAALILCCLEGQARDEAAEQLGWSLNTVKKQLERGRERLRQRLSRRGLSFPAALLATLLGEHASRAAVPALLQVAAVRTALYPESPVVVALAEGVMKTMTLSKIKMVALVLVLAVVGVGGAAWYLGHTLGAPSELAGVGALLEAKVSVSKPDADGVVTMARPLVANLAVGDPVTIMLHWATEAGPLGEAHRGLFRRIATRDTFRFTITTPDGKEQTLRANVKGQESDRTFFFAPTYQLTVGSQGLKYGTVLDPWQGQPGLSFDRPGVYTIRIQGSRVMQGPEGQADRSIPFDTGPMRVEIGRAQLKPLDQIEAAARAALDKQLPGAKSLEPVIIHEGAGGTRLVRFCTEDNPRGKWSYQEHTVDVKPDGTVGAIRQRQVFTCIAHGTLVESEAGPRAIEAIREGDRLLGYDTNQQRRVLTTVRLVRQGVAAETLRFHGTLRVTANHPLFIGSGWREAGLVTADDQLLTADLRRLPAGSPQHIREQMEVYDLTVDEPHCFFAGGFLVHNKDRNYGPHLDDIWYVLWPPAK